MVPLKQYPWLNARGVFSQTTKSLTSFLIFKLSWGKSNFDHLWPLVQIHKIYHTLIFFPCRWGFYVLVQICLEISCYENIWWVSIFVLPSKFRFSWETTMWNVPGMEFFTKWFNNLEHYEKHIKKKPSKTGTLFSSKRVPLSSNRKGYHVVIMEILKILSARYIFFYSLKNTW